MNSQKHKILCDILKVEYDFKNQTGIIFTPDMNIVNMNGAIELIESIDIKAKEIFVFQGYDIDSLYTKSNGQWISSEMKGYKNPPQFETHITEPTCYSCKYFFLNLSWFDTCRRFPPVLVDDDEFAVSRFEHPRLQPYGWCGEWKSKNDTSTGESIG